METDALGRTVIDGHEDAGRPLPTVTVDVMRPPHHVPPGDRSIMCLRVTRAVLEAVLPHQRTRSCEVRILPAASVRYPSP